MLGFERRIAGAAGPEVGEARLEMAEGLLEWDGGDVVEPGPVRVLFERGQRGGGLHVADAFLPLVPGVGAQSQRPVVHEPGTPERAGEQHGLLGCGVEPVAIGALRHGSHTTVQYVNARVGRVGRLRIPPPVKGGGLLRRN
jgi:hypothetical protein